MTTHITAENIALTVHNSTPVVTTGDLEIAQVNPFSLVIDHLKLKVAHPVLRHTLLRDNIKVTSNAQIGCCRGFLPRIVTLDKQRKSQSKMPMLPEQIGPGYHWYTPDDKRALTVRDIHRPERTPPDKPKVIADAVHGIAELLVVG